jgi:hypothetical protein
VRQAVASSVHHNHLNPCNAAGHLMLCFLRVIQVAVCNAGSSRDGVLASCCSAAAGKLCQHRSSLAPTAAQKIMFYRRANAT